MNIDLTIEHLQEMGKVAIESKCNIKKLQAALLEKGFVTYYINTDREYLVWEDFESLKFEDVMTFAEAAELWELKDSTLRKANFDKRFLQGEIRQSGGVWLVKRSAMERLYGIRHIDKLLTMDWDVVTHYMDSDIREEVHRELAPCSKEEFLSRYLELHEQKFNEKFDIN